MTISPQTPSQQLAALTVDRLIGAGLLRAEKRDDLITKIAAGEMQDEDWRLELELSADPGANE